MKVCDKLIRRFSKNEDKISNLESRVIELHK